MKIFIPYFLVACKDGVDIVTRTNSGFSSLEKIIVDPSLNDLISKLVTFLMFTTCVLSSYSDSRKYNLPSSPKYSERTHK